MVRRLVIWSAFALATDARFNGLTGSAAHVRGEAAR
jgi:hypothetical protein